MSDEQTHSHAPKGHEPLAVPIRGVAVFAVSLIVGIVVVQVLIWWLYTGVEALDSSGDKATSALADSRQPPPEPRLQPSLDIHKNLPAQDMAAMRERDIEAFKRRNWWDADKSTVVIPKTVADQVISMSKTDAAKGAGR